MTEFERIKMKWKNLIKSETKKKEKILLSALIPLFFSYTVLFFQPFESYVSNRNDIVFGIGDLVPYLLLVSLVVWILLSAFLFLLPGKISELFMTALFAFTICLYVQGNILNGTMSTLDGESIAWQNNKRHATLELVIWIVLIVLPYIVRYLSRVYWKYMIEALAGLLIMMQLVAFGSIFLTTDFVNDDQSGYISRDGMYELSSKDNIIVFVLDSFDDTYLDSALTADSELLSGLDGFTYFHNNVGTYGNTYPSITYLLTGQKYYFDTTLTDYKDNAFENAEFLKLLHENGYDNRVYTEELSVSKAADSVIENHVEGKSQLSIKGMLKGIYNLIAYRDAPFAMKAMFWFYTSDINKWAEGDFSSYIMSDPAFYIGLQEKRISLQEEKNCFRFYHMQGAHMPYVLDEAAKFVEEGTDRDRQIEGCFTIINEYIAQMKELGIYDDATILITSDHGAIGMGETPILFVKQKGERGALKTSEAPTMDADYQATMLQSAGIPFDKKLGTSVFDIPENEKRERIKFQKINTNLSELTNLKEYSIGEDAHDVNEWIETGKIWDVKYSFYKND